MVITTLFLIIGILLLYFGADSLVSGSSRIAQRLGVKPIIIGLTIVAFGTSAPELVVSINATLKGMGDISAGNIIGSNIVNIALILGISSCIYPLTVQKQLIRQDVPVMIGVSLLFMIFLVDKRLSRVDALFLLAIFSCYILWLILSAKKQSPQFSQIGNGQKGNIALDTLFMLLGFVGLVLGAHFFINSAVTIAHLLNIPQAFIGLTIIALGTSLPELSTSIVAAFKKENDIAIGNVIGSNIFNILAIMGISGAIRPFLLQGISIIDMLIMVGLSIVVFPFLWTGLKLTRVEGLFLIVVYILYTVYLFQKSMIV